METTHIPVMVDEVLTALDPQLRESFIDGTVGTGGHAEAILERTAPNGRLLGIDRDPHNLEVARKKLMKFGARVALVHGSFADSDTHARVHEWESADGILLDLGFSSAHVDDPSRGFSFQTDGPLDMRYDPKQELTAAAIVNGWTEEELAKLFRVYGEEPAAAKIAKAIIKARRERHLVTTTQLVGVITTMVNRRGKLHPATRVFQALRIATNDELGELERGLPKLINLLKPGARIAIISFHSLEDRIIKHFFSSNKDLNVITKHVVVPTPGEIRKNPRARSAKLRVAERR